MGTLIAAADRDRIEALADRLLPPQCAGVQKYSFSTIRAYLPRRLPSRSNCPPAERATGGVATSSKVCRSSRAVLWNPLPLSKKPRQKKALICSSCPRISRVKNLLSLNPWQKKHPNQNPRQSHWQNCASAIQPICARPSTGEIWHLRLFDACQSIHHLAEDMRRILEVAALLQYLTENQEDENSNKSGYLFILSNPLTDLTVDENRTRRNHPGISAR